MAVAKEQLGVSLQDSYHVTLNFQCNTRKPAFSIPIKHLSFVYGTNPRYVEYNNSILSDALIAG